MVDPLTDVLVIFGVAAGAATLMGVVYELYRTWLMWRLRRRESRPLTGWRR